MATLASNKFKELLLKKVIDGANDTFKILLMKKGFAFNRATHAVYADVTSEELTTAYGYTAGGATLAGATITNDSVNNLAKLTFNNASWLASGGNLEADGALIIDDTVTSPVIDPIVGYIDFGGTMLVYDGGTFTVANISVVVN